MGDLVRRLAEQAREQGNKGHADQGNAAPGHKLLHALALCAGVIIAVTFQQIDNAPDTEAGSQCDNEGLQNGDCAVEKCHK